MQRLFRSFVLALGAVFFASSLAVAAQTAPTPAPDTGTPVVQPHTKSTKTKKRSTKKGVRKKAKKKAAAR